MSSSNLGFNSSIVDLSAKLSVKRWSRWFSDYLLAWEIIRRLFKLTMTLAATNWEF